MVMRMMREGAAGGITKFILFGFLVLAVGGLVLMDVGGFFRGGVGGNDVARIGSEKVPIATFDRAVRRALSRVGISPAEALKLGYINEILGTEIRTSLMHQAARDLGVQIGKKRIAQQVSTLLAPAVEQGQEPQAVLDQVLRSQSMTEREFIRAIEREAAGTILGQAIQGGFAGTPRSIARDMYAFNNEKRDIDIVVLADKDTKDVKPPSEDQLKSMYESLKDQSFATPETRKVSLVFVPEVKKSVEIPEEEIKAAYEENIDSYSVPEERRLEQAVFKSEDDAKAVAELVKNGGELKKSAEEKTGSADSYLGEANFQKNGLLEEVSDKVFAVEKEGEIVGPVQTPLGWHVMIVKKIIPPETKSYESVKNEIQDELKQIKLSDQIYENANIVDDLLAGGASLDDVKKEVDLQIVDLGSLNPFGQTAGGGDALEKYGEARETILKTAYELQEGETSAVMEMPDGKFLAVHVEAIAPKTYKPFEEARAGIEKKWMEDQRRLNTRMQAAAYMTIAESGNKSLEEIAKEAGSSVRRLENVSRAGEPPAPLDPTSAQILFQTAEGDYALLGLDGSTAIAYVADVTLPERASITDNDIKELLANLDKGGKNEAMMMYLDSKEKSYNVRVNPKILQTVYGASEESP